MSKPQQRTRLGESKTFIHCDYFFLQIITCLVDVYKGHQGPKELRELDEVKRVWLARPRHVTPNFQL